MELLAKCCLSLILCLFTLTYNSLICYIYKMLRQKLLQRDFNFLWNSWRGYLTNEFKNVAQEGYQSTFVNKINSTQANSKAIASLDVAEQFHLLRSRKLAPATMDSAGYAVINYFVQSGNTKDLVAVIANRLEYGVFLTNFTAVYLLDNYLKAEDFAGAAHVAIEVALQELLNNELVLALALKACFAHLKSFPEVEAPVVVEDATEKKVRVKYVRNPVEFDMGRSKLCKTSLSQTLQQLAQKVAHADIKYNCELLSLILANKTQEFATKLKDNNKTLLQKDVLLLCQEIAKENEEVKQLLAEIEAAPTNLEDMLENLLKNASEREAGKLAAAQQKEYEAWVKQYALDKQCEESESKKIERIKNIDTMLADIKAQKQKLWFFEEEDKIDLEIYNKRPKYVKRWFGKKKKPKVIDENYVPPEIGR